MGVYTWAKNSQKMREMEELHTCQIWTSVCENAAVRRMRQTHLLSGEVLKLLLNASSAVYCLMMSDKMRPAELVM